MVLEMLIMLLGPYPGLENFELLESYPDRGNTLILILSSLDISVPLNINVLLLSTAMIVRLYLAIRFILSATKYRNSRQQRLCMINGTDATFMFSLKSFKKD